jgi:predicted negative regulator of RcsB-dependent stress response
MEKKRVFQEVKFATENQVDLTVFFILIILLVVGFLFFKSNNNEKLEES